MVLALGLVYVCCPSYLCLCWSLETLLVVSVPSRNVDDLAASGDLEEAQSCTEKPCPVDCSFQAQMT